MKIYLATLGCRLNEAENESWARDLTRDGHLILAEPSGAELIVINSCTVTAEAARKSRKLVRRLHRQSPGAPIVLTGCFAELEPRQAAELAGVDLVVGNRDKDRLAQIIAERGERAPTPAPAIPPQRSQLHPTTRTRAFVKVQDGCRNRCSFCIVTLARGEERSREIASVVAEVDGLHRNGYNEVVLTGVHLGGYGSDQGTDLSQLIAALLQRTAVPRLRLSSLEPWDISPRLFELWSDSRLCPHLHLPLQSGSDRLLRLMARRGSVDHLRQIARQAREAIPDLCLTTDVIVGFPQERDEDFHQTAALVEEIGFAHLHVFAFSARPGTAAARLAGQLPEATKRQRSQALHEIGARMKLAHLQRAVGQRRTVLWEGAGEPLPGGGRRWSGLTDNYLRVETSAPADRSLETRIALPRLRAAEDDRLVGEVVDLL
jgi:threonylcarbamoyladenosine tRNA methylthiotransferase MtaB